MKDEYKSKEQLIKELVECREQMSKRKKDNSVLKEKIFNLSPNCVAILDSNFNYLRVNESYARIHNHSIDEFPGKNYFELCLFETKDIFMQVLTTKEMARSFAEPIFNLDSLNRKKTYWNLTLIPILDSKEKIELLILYVNDVTENKSHENELHNFFNLSLDLFCVANIDGHILQINPAFEKTLGYTKEEILGQPYIKFMHPEDRPNSNSKKDKVKNGVPIFHSENRFICKDGSYKWFSWSISTSLEEGLVYVAGRDISKLKLIEEEMARLERLNLIGEMAAGIAHEIRNPMTTVRGFLQMLSSKKECIKYTEYYNLMIEELDSANSIITEFLALSKNKSIDLKLHNLNSILKSLLPLIRTEANNSDVYIEEELEEIPDLILDNREIRQLIINLVHNGTEAMPSGGKLTICTYKDEEKVVLSIKDQGKGIEPNILKKLGIPFFTTKDHGTGLGLALCYSIANRHKASINIITSSTGTNFNVRFNLLENENLIEH